MNPNFWAVVVIPITCWCINILVLICILDAECFVSQVLQDDRRGAELDYCRKFGRAWLQSGGHRDPPLNRPSAEFIEQHPRYLTLIQSESAFILTRSKPHEHSRVETAIIVTANYGKSVCVSGSCAQQLTNNVMCFTEYGAPEEGELKEQKTLVLKDKLLSESLRHSYIAVSQMHLYLPHGFCFVSHQRLHSSVLRTQTGHPYRKSFLVRRCQEHYVPKQIKCINCFDLLFCFLQARWSFRM